MSEIGAAFLSIAPSAKGFGSKLSSQVGGEVDGAGKSMGARFGKMFALAGGALAAVGIGSFVKGAISDASDLSESASKVGVVFGDQAKQIMAASKTSATAMGLTKGAYLEAAGTLGNLLVSLDIAPSKAAGLSKQMVQLAGDMASFNNTSPEDALDALRSGLTGETEPLKRYGVNMNDATLHAQALKMGLIASIKDGLTPQAKALAAQALIMDQTKTAQGDFARTSGGLANQQRILAAEFGNVKASVGKVLLPIMTKLVTFLTATVLPSLGHLGPTIAKIGSFFGPLVANIKGFLSGIDFSGFIAQVKDLAGNVLSGLVTFVTGSLIPSLRNLYTAIQPSLAEAFNLLKSGVMLLVGGLRFLGPLLVSVTGFIAAHKTAVTALVVTIGSAVAVWKAWQLGIAAWAAVTKVAAGVQLAFNAVLSANPIGLVVIALAALAAGLIYAYKHSATFRNVVNSAFTAVKTVVLGAVNAVKTAVVGTWNAIKSATSATWNAVKSATSATWGAIKATISAQINAARAAVRSAISGIQAAFSLIGALVGKVRAWFGSILSAIKSKLNEAVSFVKGIPGKMVAALGDLKTTLLHAGEDLIQGFIDGIGNKVGAVKDKLGSLTHSLTSWKGPPEKDKILLRPAGQLLMKGLVDGIGDGEGEVESKLGAVTNKIRDHFTKLRDSLKQTIDGIRSDMKSLSDSIAQAFAGDPFGVSAVEASLTGDGIHTLGQTVGQAFTNGLMSTRSKLQGLLRAFKTLKGWGIPAKFLSQLFASGNAPLILELAGGSKKQAMADVSLFSDVQSLSGKLGQTVARNQYGKMESLLEKQLARADKQISILNHLAKDIGHEINDAAAAGHKRRKAS